MPDLTFGSLFAGIGGVDLGLERAGLRCLFQVEIDSYCQSVLAAHWPHVRRYTDIRSVGSHNLPGVDVLAGGFPCQPVSAAGGRRGNRDERWLWPEFARVVGELRPGFVLVENVRGLLTANSGRAMAEVVGHLADLGYDSEWSVVPACAVGAPHTRERVFLLAHANDPRLRSGRSPRDGDDEPGAARRTGAEHLRAAAVPGGGEGRAPWAAEPGVGRMADGLSPRLDGTRLRALGNAVVPAVAELVGRRLIGRAAPADDEGAA